MALVNQHFGLTLFLKYFPRLSINATQAVLEVTKNLVSKIFPSIGLSKHNSDRTGCTGTVLIQQNLLGRVIFNTEE